MFTIHYSHKWDFESLKFPHSPKDDATCYLRKFPLKIIEKCNLLFWATVNLNQGHFTGKSGSSAILIISVISINERTIRNSEAAF